MSWFASVAALILALLVPAFANGQARSAAKLAFDASRGGGVFGPSIAVDLCFPYYRTKPVDDLCREIQEAGFTCVHLIDYGASPTSRLRELSEAIHRRGMTATLAIYPGTHPALYKQHPEWRQKMLTGVDGKCDWRTYLCPNQPGFVTAYCDDVERRMRETRCDAIQLNEIWFEGWGGPELNGAPNPYYACACDACVERFRRLASVDAREMLTKPSSRLYFKRPENAALYERWVRMRVDTIQEFGKSIIAAARRGASKARVKVMYMADVRVRLDGGREYLGNDLDRMLREWKPDVLTLEDAWQDWSRKDLSANFVADYARAYKDRVKKLCPNIFVMSHADIGSSPTSKRSPQWIHDFAEQTVKAGFGAPSFYEWNISVMAAGGSK